jgi:hypothetical protein
MSFMALIVYQLHQFEEHGIDLMGQYYAFGPYVNNIIGGFVGCPTVSKDCPLNVENIFYINMVMVWLPLLVSAHIAERRPFLAACFISILPVNALAHIGVALVHQEYNPGLFTAVMLFLPFSFFYYRRLLAEKRLSRARMFCSFLYGVIGHLFMMGALVLGYVRGDYATAYYPLILSLYILLPLILGCLKCCSTKGCAKCCCPKGCAKCSDCGGCSGCCGCECMTSCDMKPKATKAKVTKAKEKEKASKPVAAAKPKAKKK